MLKLDMGSNGQPIKIQEVTSPKIYLDLNALMNIALQDNSREKFKAMLVTKKGTLLFSWMHLLELSDVTDKEQLRFYVSFLNSLIENLGFIDVVPAAVIAKENQKLQGDNNVNPPIDERLFSFLDTIIKNAKSINPLSFDWLLTNLNHPVVVEHKKQFHLKFNSSLVASREKKGKDNKYGAKLKAVEKEATLPFATRYIEKDILNSFLREGNRLPSNSWRDFYHTVVPVAYCDYVLLDRGFVHRANSTIDRLRRNNYTAPMAKVFSKIDGLFGDLENYRLN